jgi:peptidoglycan/xylan/chitin deacetylase (PgdA/CDA1 family)
VGLRRAALSILSPAGGRARLQVLTYHRVLPEPDPLLPDEPDAAAFRAQMTALARLCNVLPLPEAAERLAAGTLPARAACVTFDDGYTNNQEVAAPILEEAGLPATFFIAGGAVDRGIMWNDLVIEAIRRARTVLDCDPVGRESVPLPDIASRVAAVPQILDAMKYRPLAERWDAAVALYERNVEGPPPRLMMTRDQVRDLARRGFDVGGHTVSHPILATLSPAEARQEIAGSWQWVRDVTGVAPRSFAYPNGRPGRDFDDSHVAMAREAGFEVAVTTVWGSALRRHDVLQLPRYSPWETAPAGLWGRLVKTTVRSYLR